jgi:hypothetical protein
MDYEDVHVRFGNKSRFSGLCKKITVIITNRGRVIDFYAGEKGRAI